MQKTLMSCFAEPLAKSSKRALVSINCKVGTCHFSPAWDALTNAWFLVCAGWAITLMLEGILEVSHHHVLSSFSSVSRWSDLQTTPRFSLRSKGLTNVSFKQDKKKRKWIILPFHLCFYVWLVVITWWNLIIQRISSKTVSQFRGLLVTLELKSIILSPFSIYSQSKRWKERHDIFSFSFNYFCSWQGWNWSWNQNSYTQVDI